MLLNNFKDEQLKNKSGIYQIRNLIDNKVYIGSSLNLYKRIYYHIYKLNRNKHNNKHLQNAWNKYGEENFVFEILEFVVSNNELLKKKETHYIQKFNVCDKSIGYNLSTDACRNIICDESKQKIKQKAMGNKNWLGRHHTEETKQKMSKWHTGKIVKQSTKEKLSKLNKGIPKWTKEQRIQMSISRKGKNCGKLNGMYGRKGELNPFYGKHHTQEFKDKLSKCRMGQNNPSFGIRGKSCSWCKPFMCIETGEIFWGTGEYKRIKQKSNATGILRCCRGLQKTAYGYHWMLLDRKELQ